VGGFRQLVIEAAAREADPASRPVSAIAGAIWSRKLDTKVKPPLPKKLRVVI